MDTSLKQVKYRSSAIADDTMENEVLYIQSNDCERGSTKAVEWE